ncbi:MAG: sigma-70 family RNA polymerase sigma factor [Myxococcota bacterium]
METVADAFAAHERLLWGLGYRMTGLASDADELVQETFLRAIEHPVPDDGRPLRPWLVRVCANLARDRLRARRRRGAQRRDGAWLPSPVPSERLYDADGTTIPGADSAAILGATTPDADTPEARYTRTETAGLAFLLALEALTPTQRAVLLLRDVFELDADEVAAALGSTPGAVRVAHHKARRSLEGRAPNGRAPDNHAAATSEATLAALTTFLGALATGDAAAALAQLAPDVVLRSDGGGVFSAAKVPVLGAEKVVKFLLHVASAAGPENRWEIRSLNGAPMAVVELMAPAPGRAPRFVVGVTLGPTGKIVAIHWVLDPAKLTTIPPLA